MEYFILQVEKVLLVQLQSFVMVSGCIISILIFIIKMSFVDFNSGICLMEVVFGVFKQINILETWMIMVFHELLLLGLFVYMQWHFFLESQINSCQVCIVLPDSIEMVFSWKLLTIHSFVF